MEKDLLSLSMIFTVATFLTNSPTDSRRRISSKDVGMYVTITLSSSSSGISSSSIERWIRVMFGELMGVKASKSEAPTYVYYNSALIDLLYMLILTVYAPTNTFSAEATRQE